MKKKICGSANLFDLKCVGVDFGLCAFDKATDVKTAIQMEILPKTLEMSFKINGNIDGTPEATSREAAEATRAHFH